MCDLTRKKCLDLQQKFDQLSNETLQNFINERQQINAQLAECERKFMVQQNDIAARLANVQTQRSELRRQGYASYSAEIDKTYTAERAIKTEMRAISNAYNNEINALSELRVQKAAEFEHLRSKQNREFIIEAVSMSNVTKPNNNDFAKTF